MIRKSPPPNKAAIQRVVDSLDARWSNLEATIAALRVQQTSSAALAVAKAAINLADALYVQQEKRP